MRQKLALVVAGPPSVALRRMNGVSPVRMTRLASALLMVRPPWKGGGAHDRANAGGRELPQNPVCAGGNRPYRPGVAPGEAAMKRRDFLLTAAATLAAPAVHAAGS